MTSLGLPAQSAMQLANGAAANASLISERGAGGHNDSQDGPAFSALLSALDDSGAQPQPADGATSGNSAPNSTLPAQPTAEALPAAASWRSISAVHSLGSGVLVALDKRFDSTAHDDSQSVSSSAPKTGANTSADASALASIGWASLVGSMSGATPTPAASSALASGPAINKVAIANATIQDPMPSDAALATSTQTSALSAATPPVAVKVVRSITYLGLDPTARNVQAATGASATASVGVASAAVVGKDAAAASATIQAATGASAPASVGVASAAVVGKDAAVASAPIQDAAPSDAPPPASTQAGAPSAQTSAIDGNTLRTVAMRNVASGQASTSASVRSAATGSSGVVPVSGQSESNTPVALTNAQGGSSAMSNGDQSKQNTHGAGVDESASDKIARADQELTSDSGQTAPAAGLSGVMQASLGAMSGNNLTLVPIGQLADVIASAAQGLGSQIGDAASSGATATTTNAARTAPVKELDVQLNPASLGGLSIQMRLSNGNLNVTIKADKSDTLKLIENESGAISDKLKSLNFSVESLTVKASDVVASGSASADTSNTGTSGYGEAQQGQSGQTAGGSRNGQSLQGGEQKQSAQPGRENIGEAGGDGDFGHRVV